MCQRFHAVTLPLLLPQLIADGFTADCIKVVVNGAPEERIRISSGVEYLFTKHDAWEYSAYYEAGYWSFDYALVIHDTAVIIPGCRETLHAINGAIRWDILPATTQCNHGVAIASREHLLRLRPRLAALHQISKREGVFFEFAGGLMRGARYGLSMAHDAVIERRRSEQIIEGGELRDKVLLAGVNIYKLVNRSSCDRGTVHML